MEQTEVGMIVRTGCAHQRAKPELSHEEKPGGGVVTLKIVCLDCGAEVWLHGAMGAQHSVSIPWTWEQPKQAPKKRQTVPEWRRVWESVESEWKSRGGTIPEWVPNTEVAKLRSVKDGIRFLVLGDGGGIVSFALDHGGADHVLVTDRLSVMAELQPRKRTTIKTWDWEPGYGEMWDGVVVCGAIPEKWVERLPSLMKPGGDCWLLGASIEHVEMLVEKWGYRPQVRNRGLPTEMRFFAGEQRPLGEGPGTELHDAIKALGMPECQACRALAHRMNEWGVDGCREHLGDITSEMLPRARNWWEHADFRNKLKVWWEANPTLAGSLKAAKQLAGDELDDLLSDALQTQVNAAIERAISTHPRSDVHSEVQ